MTRESGFCGGSRSSRFFVYARAKGVAQMDADLAKMKSTIDLLQKVYMVLFGISLVLLVGSWTVAMPSGSGLAWAVALGGAVLTRLYRTSLVNKYNARLQGERATLQ
jgi:S1-C subfamily serine protease